MSVFLADVDDYVAPSQACINPLFSPPIISEKNGENQDAASSTSYRDPQSHSIRQTDREGAGSVTVRRSRIVRSKPKTLRAHSPDVDPASHSVSTANSGKQRTADIADCLACSGCVTTAETVLLKQHSIEQFRTAHMSAQDIVVTLSPASAAEFLRMLSGEDGLVDAPPSRLSDLNRQLAALLCHELHARAVLDGALPLSWSLHQAGIEFCQHYRNQQQASGVTHRRRRAAMISSSCPAAVCLIEKNHHSLVSHLARVKSPMATAGVYWSTGAEPGQSLYHVAIMPCHDKKLEATRSDISGVHLVLTTQECWQLLLEQQQSKRNGMPNDVAGREVKELFRTLTPAPVERVDGCHFTSRRSRLSGNAWITCSNPIWSQPPYNGAIDAPSLTYTSGGYADFIFRYAAFHLFGSRIDRVPWAAPVSTPGMISVATPSARVAQARRDVLSVTLYQHIITSSSPSLPSTNDTCWYSCEAEPKLPDVKDIDPAAAVTSTPVLSFVMAHGMQTMLRTLVAATTNSGGSSLDDNKTLPSIDYIEAMACPSGCLNGGGQVLSGHGIASSSSSSSPTPPKLTMSSMRERVDRTAHFLYLPRRDTDESDGATATATPLNTDQGWLWTFEAAPASLLAHFQAVQPLRVQKGVAAGSAVKDLQW